MLFDEPYYIAINEARWQVLAELLSTVAAMAPLARIVDAGCGPGWFAARLSDAGYQVLGLEGRPELVQVARGRAPDATFEHFDFDAVGLSDITQRADAVLAFGLLYHLENPLRALRILRGLAQHTVFLETMTIPEDGPYGRLVTENPNETQGLRPMAFVLTPTAIGAALHQVGFKNVYRYTATVAHQDFANGAERLKRRDIFVASDLELRTPLLELVRPAKLGRYDYSPSAAVR